MAAAGLIRVGGLCKGVLRDREGRHCAVGAICNAVENHVVNPSLQWDLMNESFRRLRVVAQTEYIASWNDDLKRTADDVIEALEKAAEVQ